MSKEDTKTNAMRLLDAAAIPYRDHYYDGGDGKIDGVSVANKVALPLEQVYKTLLNQGASGAYHIFMIPVAAELDLKKAARAAGEKSVQMAPAKDLLKLTGYVHGGCSPLGLKKPFPIYIDESAILLDTMVFSAGRIGAQIECAPDALCDFVHGHYADLCK